MASYETAHEYLRELDRLRRSQEVVISKINRIHAKLSKTSAETAESYNETLWMKLRKFYTDAKQYADEEDRVCQALMVQLETFMAPGQTTTHRKKSEGAEQKRRRMKAEADPARLSSPSTNHRCSIDHGGLVGDQVAARISPDNADKDDWIVVKVTRVDRESSRKNSLSEWRSLMRSPVMMKKAFRENTNCPCHASFHSQNRQILLVHQTLWQALKFLQFILAPLRCIKLQWQLIERGKQMSTIFLSLMMMKRKAWTGFLREMCLSIR